MLFDMPLLRLPRPRALCVGLALLVIVALASPVRAQAAQPEHITGSWFEQVQMESGNAGRALDAARVGAIIEERHGPALAGLRSKFSASAAPTWKDRFVIYQALADERLAELATTAERSGVPKFATAGERVVWQLASGDEAGALVLVDALPESDTSIDARVARIWARIAHGGEFEDHDARAAELDACRSEAHGAAATLVMVTDRRFRELAEIRRAWNQREETQPPAWARRPLPPLDALAAATALDQSAMTSLIEEALAVAPVATQAIDPAIAILERAAQINVLDPRPHIEAAKRWLGRLHNAEALVAIDRALRRDPLDDSAWAIRAIAARGSGDERGALLSAERALELRPGDPSHEERYVGSLVRLGLLDEAAAVARGVYAYAPDQPWSAIAVALQKNVPYTSMFQDALLETLERHLSDNDLEARLWAAAASSVARREVSGEARALVEGLVQFHARDDVGHAAAALLEQTSSKTPFWSGLALFVHGNDGEATLQWRRDALGRGVDAMRARGWLTYLGDQDATVCTDDEVRSGTAPLPAWLDVPLELVPRLPDDSATAVRVPVEAATIEQALGALPVGGSRVVLGRGTYAAPSSITRSVTLVGSGTEWNVGTELRSTDGMWGESNVATTDQCCAQLVDLRVALRLKATAGALALRRCRFTTSMSIGGGSDATAPLVVELDHVQSDVTLNIHHTGGRLTIRDCIVSPTRDLSSNSFLGGVSGTVQRSVFLAAQGRSAAMTGGGADLHFDDCVFIGAPAADGTLQTAVATFDGGRATVRRGLAFDVDPLADPLVDVADSRMRRTPNTSDDTGGWTVFGTAVALLDANAPVVRVPEDASSLDAAIARAAPGATIQLGSGVFELGARIDRPLRIVGTGLLNTTVRLTSSNPTLYVDTRVELERLFLADSTFDPNYGISQSALFTTIADAPPLATVAGGDLWFGADVRVRGPLGLRFAASGGGVVRGGVANWDATAKVLLEAPGDSAIVLGEQPWRTGYAVAGGLRTTRFPQTVVRPTLLALAPQPELVEAHILAQRLARVDAYLNLVADKATGVQLADIANRLWGLLPASSRVKDVLCRITPRLDGLARSDARVGVEEVISFVFSDFGPGVADEQVFNVIVGVGRSFRAACPASAAVYVEARLSGMNEAQADLAARGALMMESLGAGRTEQALALASELGDAARARVLVVHRPDTLTYEQLLTLSRATGLDPLTAQRLAILTSALLQAPEPLQPLPLTGWNSLQKYFDAERTGQGNEYYSVTKVYDPTGTYLYSKVSERSDWVVATPANKAPRPGAPQSGSNEAAWNDYYAALESWDR